MNIPLHKSFREDGTPGCYRLRVALFYAKTCVKKRLEFGLRTTDRREAAFRACWILKGLVTAESLYLYATMTDGERPAHITHEMVNEWLAETGFMKREVRYSQAQAKRNKRKGIDFGTDPMI